jgi:AP endonuclease family 2 C terminus.
MYSGYQSSIDRTARLASSGDCQIYSNGILSKLTQYEYSGWGTMEWECYLKHPQDGTREGADIIRELHHDRHL